LDGSPSATAAQKRASFVDQGDLGTQITLICTPLPPESRAVARAQIEDLFVSKGSGERRAPNTSAERYR
jgi:hypothetical protein